MSENIEEPDVANDEVIDSEGSYGVYQQEEDVLFWAIDGLYKDNNRLRDKKSLKVDPPKLTIESESGKSTEFLLTKNFVDDLSFALELTKKGLYGVDARDEYSLSDKGIKHSFIRGKDWVERHIIVSALFSFVVVSVVVSAIIK